jgi:hypothetical protein
MKHAVLNVTAVAVNNHQTGSVARLGRNLCDEFLG